MKDLLVKLTRSTVNICFKSGDKMDNVIIESIIGNTIVANYEGKITVIEIPHIAYVSTEIGIMEAMKTILGNQQNTQVENKDSKNNNQSSNENSNENKEKDKEKDSKKDTEKDTEKDKEKDIEKDKEKGTEKDKEKDTEKETEKDNEKDTEKDKKKDIQKEKDDKKLFGY